MNYTNKLNVYTLDGKALLSYFSNTIKSHKFIFNMDNVIISGDIVSKFEEYNVNPLFYQLIQCIKDESNFIDDENCIKEYIVFIDFNEIFKLKDELILNKVKLIFDGNQYRYIKNRVGINLSFNNKTYRYVPYDKSNSMSKDGKISFIRQDIKEKLDERLLLGFEEYLINNIPLEHSKFLSYKGLYLSDCKRIDVDIFKNLDEEKVIIINETEDIVDTNRRYNKYTFGKHKNNTKNRKQVDVVLNSNNEIVGDYFVENENVKIPNSYDGEGLISFEYAEALNEFIQEDATSYQIRLPFTKGVLHKVDFHSFFNESIKGINSPIYVKDAFGIDRDLSKAEIILTTSMFKCSRWLEEIAKLNNNNGDIVKAYFDAYRKNDHCLYLVQTDNNIKGKGKERLTYQFLNTVDMDLEAFKELNDKQLSYLNIDNIRESLIEKNSKEKWVKAVELNKGFYNDCTVKGLQSSQAGNYVLDIATGNYLINGESRILAGDLLALLIHIYEYSIKDNKKNKFDIDNTNIEIQNIKKQQIFSSHFYMPRPKIKLRHDRCYAIFRSPHLSRLEECIAKPYIPDPNNSVYRKYFGHLKGILMVAQNSLIPSLLGGADFDGDHVCLYADETVVKAVKKGNYNNDNIRNSPIIAIPSIETNKRAFKHIRYDIIANTFSNSIGLISNFSIKGAVKEYGRNTEDDNFNKYCEKCTITTGLEIDAAKHGEHPTALINDLINKMTDINSYIDIIKVFDKYNKISNIKGITEKDNTKEIEFKNDNSNNKVASLKILEPKDVDNNLLAIPHYFSKAFLKYKELNYKENQQQLFKIEKPKLDKTKVDNVRDLIIAYKEILSLKTKSNDIMQQIKNDNSISCAYVKLGEAFGDYEYILSNNNTVNNEFHKLLADLNERFLTYDNRATFNTEKLYERIINVNEIYNAIKQNCDEETLLEYKKQIVYSLSYKNKYYDLLLPLDINDLLLFAKFIFAYFMIKKPNLVKDIIHDSLSNNVYVKQMVAIIDDYIDAKITSSQFNNKIKEFCLTELNEIFDNDLTLSPYYVYKSNNSDCSKFFWDVLPEEIILSQILED